MEQVPLNSDGSDESFTDHDAFMDVDWDTVLQDLPAPCASAPTETGNLATVDVLLSSSDEDDESVDVEAFLEILSTPFDDAVPAKTRREAPQLDFNAGSVTGNSVGHSTSRVSKDPSMSASSSRNTPLKAVALPSSPASNVWPPKTNDTSLNLALPSVLSKTENLPLAISDMGRSTPSVRDPCTTKGRQPLQTQGPVPLTSLEAGSSMSLATRTEPLKSSAAKGLRPWMLSAAMTGSESSARRKPWEIPKTVDECKTYTSSVTTKGTRPSILSQTQGSVPSTSLEARASMSLATRTEPPMSSAAKGFRPWMPSEAMKNSEPSTSSRRRKPWEIPKTTEDCKTATRHMSQLSDIPSCSKIDATAPTSPKANNGEIAAIDSNYGLTETDSMDIVGHTDNSATMDETPLWKTSQDSSGEDEIPLYTLRNYTSKDIFVHDTTKCRRKGVPKLFIRDILKAERFTGKGCTDYMYTVRGLVFECVRARGVITSIDKTIPKPRLIVDDGSAAICCFFDNPTYLDEHRTFFKETLDEQPKNYNKDNKQQQAVFILLESGKEDLENFPSPNDFNLGDTIEFKANVNLYKGRRYLYIKKVFKDRSGEVEHDVNHFKFVNYLYEKVYPDIPKILN